MTVEIDPSNEITALAFAAELHRKRWQERPGYFSTPRAKPEPKLPATQRQPVSAASAMRRSALHGLEA